MKKTIFLVDDNATNLTIAEDVLSKFYRVISLSSAAQMFSTLEKFTPDLILLDVEMPEMSGFQAMKLLKASDSYSIIPVIFLTSRTDTVSEAFGIEMGAVDFITKPFSEPVLLNRIKNHLHIDEMIRERTAKLVEQSQQLVKLQNGIVFTMADLVENRDKNTGGHIDRTTVYMRTFIEGMISQGIYADEISAWNIDSIVSSARLHDVGKIVIPDSILNKQGRLTNEEFDIMKTHSKEGERIIDKIIQQTGEAEFLRNARIIAAYHHERWDGKGYPYGLRGKDIPLQARLMSVIDVYDALVSDRAYKEGFTHEEAISIIRDSSGENFDPLATEVFININEQIAKLKEKFV